MRPALRAYDRDPSTQLASIDASVAGELLVRRRERWSRHIDGSPCETGPLSGRFVEPLLARSSAHNEGQTGVELLWPGSLFPQGFRAQILAHCGIAVDPGEELIVRALDRSSMPSLAERSSEQLLALARLMNLWGLFGLCVRRLGPICRAVRYDLLTYEVARAAYVTTAEPVTAIRPFLALASGDQTDRTLRLAAIARIIAALLAQEPGRR